MHSVAPSIKQVQRVLSLKEQTQVLPSQSDSQRLPSLSQSVEMQLFPPPVVTALVPQLLSAPTGSGVVHSTPLPVLVTLEVVPDPPAPTGSSITALPPHATARNTGREAKMRGR